MQQGMESGCRMNPSGNSNQAHACVLPRLLPPGAVRLQHVLPICEALSVIAASAGL